MSRLPDPRASSIPLNVWLRLARASNLPTVWSNVLAGSLLGGGDPWGDPVRIMLLLASLTLFYVGGMIFNDVFDAEHDLRENPDRPIPSGRISVRAAAAAAGGALLLGVLLLLPLGGATVAFGLLLLSAILSYNALHHRFRVAAVLMGACRGLIYPLAAAAWDGWDSPVVLAAAAALTIYTVLLTTAAADEAAETPHPSRWAMIGLPLVTLPTAGILMNAAAGGLLIGVALLLAGWLAYTAAIAIGPPARVRAGVMAGLAGLCLVDACWLAARGMTGGATFCVALFALARVMGRRISGT